MWRASLIALGLGLGLAWADPRAQLGTQLAAETQTIDTALATVTDKLAAAEALRVRRLRAAYLILRSRPPEDPEERMLYARRVAGARLLVERDAAERALLAHEADNLREARTVTIAATEKLPEIALPAELAAPVKGKIVRRFGTFEHERSHATLSRHGIELEGEDHAPVAAPADGTVRYAGAIRGLDHGVVLDHGGYLTIVARLSELSLPVGTHVARGDRVGRATRRRVYLEVRVKLGPGGLPIDPEPLLVQ